MNLGTHSLTLPFFSTKMYLLLFPSNIAHIPHLLSTVQFFQKIIMEKYPFVDDAHILDGADDHRDYHDYDDGGQAKLPRDYGGAYMQLKLIIN